MIVVWAWLRGPRGERDGRLALDTGAVKTLILPDVLDDIGYNVRDGEGITIIRTANDAPEPGYTAVSLRQRGSELGERALVRLVMTTFTVRHRADP